MQLTTGFRVVASWALLCAAQGCADLLSIEEGQPRPEDASAGGGPSTGTAGAGPGSGGTAGVGGSGNGAGGGGGGPSSNCNASSVRDLFDDFDINGANGTLWQVTQGPGAIAAQVTGEVVMQFPSGNPGRVAAYESQLRYDITSCYVTIELTTAPPPAANCDSFFSVTTIADVRAVLSVHAGMLQAELFEGTKRVSFRETAFSETSHRFLSIRENDGMFYFEAGASPAQQTSFHSASHFTDVTGVTVGFGGMAIGSGPADDVAFDNLNTLGGEVKK